MNISTLVYISLSLEFVDLLKFNVYIYFRMDGVCLFWEPKFKVAFFCLTSSPCDMVTETVGR
jgi:hypothetical protein